MISKSEISSSGDAAKYHDKAFNQDGSLAQSDNYYVSERASAIWQGKGAAILGIEGKTVEKDQFVRFLDGKMPHPKTGEIQDLASNAKGQNRQAGFDLTVAPPKSVSVLALVGKDHRIIDAHEVANKVALQWLEKHGSMVRVRQDGNVHIQHKENLLYASVMHVTNRDNEPHLHSHNVIVSAVFDKESDKWRSLTNTEIYQLRAKADIIYKSELAAQLKSQGYELEYAKNGMDFEIKGLSKEQLSAFSGRSQEIGKALQARGMDREDASYHARQAATLDSRKGKVELERGTLDAAWSAIAVDHGLNLPEMVAASQQRAATRVVSATPGVLERDHVVVPAVIETVMRKEGVTDQQRSGLLAVSWAIKHLAEREQSFKATDVELTALRFERGQIGDIEWAIQKHVENGFLIDRGQNDAGAKFFTTARAITAEEDLNTAIQQGKNNGNTILSARDDFIRIVSEFNAKKTQETGSDFRLSEEQIRAAQHILAHPDAIQGIQGEAGTGKTAALAMVREVAEAKGWDVIGMATSASAAVELERSSGIKSQTIASFFAERERAINLAKADVDGIKSQIMQKASGHQKPLESKILDVRGDFTDFGKARYIFDHAQGTVYKSDLTLRNAVGIYLLELAGQQRQHLDLAKNGKQTVWSGLKADALVRGSNLAEKAGRSITSMEQVGTVEAILARRTLYLSRSSTIGDLKEELAKKQAELQNLERTGHKDGRRVLMVMDEASLTGAEDAVKFLKQAQAIGARVVLQGDVKQHGSVPAGRAFALAQTVGMNVATLTETRRFDRAALDVQQAVKLMQDGQFAKAVSMLRRQEVSEYEFVKGVVDRYMGNLNALIKKDVTDPLVGVVTLTNRDRKDINAAISKELSKRGHIGSDDHTKQHLDYPKLTDAQKAMSGELQIALVDTVIFNRSNKAIGVDKGEILKVISFNQKENKVIARTPDGKVIEFNPQKYGNFTPAIMEKRDFHQGDKIEARDVIRIESAPARNGHGVETLRIANGTKGVIEKIDQEGAVIKWADGKSTVMTNRQLMHVDYAYAHTTFKEQGATVHREVIALSTTGAQIFNREAAYVAATRAKGVSEIVVTDKGLEKMLENAGKKVDKTTAVDWEERLNKALEIGGGLPTGRIIGKNAEVSKSLIKENGLTR